MTQQAYTSRGRLRLKPRGTRAPERGAAQSLEEALAELVLLREENARLTAAAHEPPNLGRVVARLRSLAGGRNGHDEHGDDVAQMLVNGVVLRESLLEVCRELERSIAAIRASLEMFEVEDGHGGAAGGG